MTTMLKADPSGAVTLPADLCRAAGVAPGADLVAEVQAGRIVLAPVRPPVWERILALTADAPPAELEVDFNVDVYFPKENAYRPLGEISPVVRTLAREQFDDYVKRVRVFVHPRIATEARQLRNLSERLANAIGRT